MPSLPAALMKTAMPDRRCASKMLPDVAAVVHVLTAAPMQMTLLAVLQARADAIRQADILVAGGVVKSA